MSHKCFISFKTEDKKYKSKRQIASTVTFSGGCFAATDI